MRCIIWPSCMSAACCTKLEVEYHTHNLANCSSVYQSRRPPPPPPPHEEFACIGSERSCGKSKPLDYAMARADGMAGRERERERERERARKRKIERDRGRDGGERVRVR
jgi:hypothetical protein